MNKEEILTEYFENIQQPEGEEPFFGEGSVAEVLAVDVDPGEAFVVSFSEEDLNEDAEEEEVFFDEFFFEEDEEEGEEGFDDFSLEEISFDEEDLKGLGDEFSEDIQEIKEEISNTPDLDDNFLPGATEPILEEDDDKEDEADDVEVETNWVDDRDPSKFINYLRDSYSNIPPHTGNTISGCERALAYLNKLHREISEAIRNDDKNALDEVLDEIEEYRVKILKGMVALKKRIGDLKRKFKEEGSQKIANEALDLIKESLESNEIKKEAKSGSFQMVITPFERAITGMLINSVVSAGHPFEEVYDYLKKKFDITPREELAILQIIMDMGFPIFKDRGTIGESGDGDKKENGQGIDFIKNYFA